MNRIKILKGDIAKITVDAIVNAANSYLLGGGGVDGAIHKAAGRKLLKECRKLGGCETGKAKITQGYNLPAKFIIHTVGPIYDSGKQGESELLASCYCESLKLAAENGIKTIAFPCISTGVYGYPFCEACVIALRTIEEFLKANDSITQIYMVCYSDSDFERFKAILKDFA